MVKKHSRVGPCSQPDTLGTRQPYAKAALKFHPDVNKAPDATDRFNEIKMAYNTLSDPEQR
jgi:DnaJ-class molecular chaperone